MKRHMNNRNKGFTLVEVLAVVGILVILLAISIVPVSSYRDKLKIAELDNAAREIFMAAENRAVLLHDAQRLNGYVNPAATYALTDGEDNSLSSLSLDAITKKNSATKSLSQHSEDEELYYLNSASAEDLLGRGTIDAAFQEPNVEFYIVFDLKSGSVTDVFYAEKTGEEEATPLSDLIDSYGGSTYAEQFLNFYSDWSVSREDRLALKKSADDGEEKDLLVGWYDGQASQVTELEEMEPSVKVMITNDELLTVTVDYEYISSTDEPRVSGFEVLLGPDDGTVLSAGEYGNSVDLTTDFSEPRFDGDLSAGKPNEEVIPETNSKGKPVYRHKYTCEWILDSLTGGLTREEPLYFKELVEDTINGGYKVNPGADFRVTATVTLDNGNSDSKSDANNSLFGRGSGGETARILCLRHLQNLSADGVFDSGVNEGAVKKKSALQEQTIDGKGYGIYNTYAFKPITNDNIASYNGQGKEICGLNLYVTDTSASVGLFSTVSNKLSDGSEKSEMTLSNIRMVNTTMLSENPSNVGVLAGEATGAKISDCWVYWEPTADDTEDTYVFKGDNAGGLVGKATDTEITGCRVYWYGDKEVLQAVLGKDNACNYQLSGLHVGGLVGTAGGTTKIDASLAATTLENTIGNGNVAGGLIGVWDGAAGTPANPNIKNSYADCYLGGTNNAGLVGNVGSGGIRLENCYAAGYINRPENSWLCGGSGTTTAINVYSVMLSLEANTDTSTPNIKFVTVPMEKNDSPLSNGSTVYYLGTGSIANATPVSSEDLIGFNTTGSKTNSLKTVGFKTADETNPYNLQTYVELNDYPYPALDLPHYGDWGEYDGVQEQPLELTPLSLVYYEKYNDGTWGFSVGGTSVSGAALKDGAEKSDARYVLDDGYGMLFKLDEEDEPAEAMETSISITTKDISIFPTDEVTVAWDNDKKELTSEQLKFVGKDNNNASYYLLDVKYQKEAVAGFYQGFEVDSVSVGGIEKWDTEENTKSENYIFFNPHFADTVVVSENSDTPTIPGTSANPVRIRTARHLNLMANYYCNPAKDNNAFTEEYLAKTYSQDLNLDYTTYAGTNGVNGSAMTQNPIASNDDNRFTGIYEGNDYTITGVNISGGARQGLFGNVEGTTDSATGDIITGIIRKVHVVDGFISGSNGNVGGIVAVNNGGLVTECSFRGTNGTVENTGTTGNNGNVGGIVGYNNTGGTVELCYNTGTVTDAISQYVGGIVGHNKGIVTQCYNTGDVTGDSSSTSDVGGVVGYNADRNSQVTKCHNEGDEVSGGDQVGGIVGNNKGTVTECYNIGKLVSGSTHVGGVAGENSSNNGQVSKSYNTGEVISSGGYAGGVVGYNAEQAQTINSYNTGAVTGEVDGSGQQYVGGIVGYIYNPGTNVRVQYCYSIGEVTGSSNVGGGVGGVAGTGSGNNVVQNCYYLEGRVNSVSTSINNSATEINEFEFARALTFGATSDWYVNGTGNANTNAGVWKMARCGDDSGHHDEHPVCYRPILVGNQEKTEGLSLLDDSELTYENKICVTPIRCSNAMWGFSGFVGKSASNTGKDEIMRLKNDIALGSNNAKQWVPIGTYSTTPANVRTFEGTFDGAGKNITGLYINKTGNNADYQGLFGYVGSSGTVDNFKLTGEVTGRNYVGAVVARNDGTVQNCTNVSTGDNNVNGYSQVGGIVGYNTNKVSRCGNNSNVTINGNTDDNKYAGGIVGLCADGSSVSECYNTGSIRAFARAGGILGQSGEKDGDRVTLTNCYNTGRISGDSSTQDLGSDTGGIVGRLHGSAASGYPFLGNYVPPVTTYIEITNCYNIGWVKNHNSGYGDRYDCSGNIIGVIDGEATETNCYYVVSTETNATTRANGKTLNSSVGTNNALKGDTPKTTGLTAANLNTGGSNIWEENAGKGHPTLVYNPEQ